MYNRILSIADIDWCIRRIEFKEDTLVCHKKFGVGIVLHKDYEIMNNPNVFAENYWYVCFDKSTDGKVIRSIRADQLKSIKNKEEAKYYDWNKHNDKLINAYRKGEYYN